MGQRKDRQGQGTVGGRGERDTVSTGSLATWLQWPGLSEAGAGSQESRLDLAHVCVLRWEWSSWDLNAPSPWAFSRELGWSGADGT